MVCEGDQKLGKGHHRGRRPGALLCKMSSISLREPELGIPAVSHLPGSTIHEGLPCHCPNEASGTGWQSSLWRLLGIMSLLDMELKGKKTASAGF